MFKFVCKSYIERVAEWSKTKLAARGQVVSGDPAKAIVAYADNNNIDPMLLATHGQSGFGRWTKGSTAHKIITTSKIPIFLIRPNVTRSPIPSTWPNSILVPLDGSPLAESVLPYMIDLAQQGQTHQEVILLKICEGSDLLDDYPEAIMEMTWQEHIKRATTAFQQTCSMYLDQIQDRYQVDGGQIRSGVILGDKDNVAPEIAGFVSKKSCDVIAMSTHGSSGISEWPFGHIADTLIPTVSVPLFLVRSGTS